MAASKIIPPIVLFLDDGVHIYGCAEEVEIDLEAPDVRDSPEWRGFDSNHNGLSLGVIAHRRKVLGLLTINEERVQLRVDESVSLDSISDTIREQMVEYLLFRNNEVNEAGLMQMTAKNLLDQILNRVRSP
jgi:hypothetical protein